MTENELGRLVSDLHGYPNEWHYEPETPTWHKRRRSLAIFNRMIYRFVCYPYESRKLLVEYSRPYAFSFMLFLRDIKVNKMININKKPGLLSAQGKLRTLDLFVFLQ